MATQVETIELQDITAPEQARFTTRPSIDRKAHSLADSTSRAQDEAVPSPDEQDSTELSGLRAAIIMISIASVGTVTSMTNGLLSTGLPSMQHSLALSDALLVWPASIYGLTGGCTFILVGSIADIMGSRPVFLFGCLFLSLTILACGLARTGTELIAFRGLQGVATSCCLPTALSILTSTFPRGRRRTRGMVLQGVSQTIGYSLGLFLGGLFADTIGWRWGWYIAAAMSIAVFVASLWAVPLQKRHGEESREPVWRQVATNIDWVGAVLASLCLGLISYILA